MGPQLLDGTTAAGAVLVFSLVAALGLALGSLKVRGIGLGIAGVLFVGIAFGHFGVHVEERTREFVRELGLVFFVYSIGLQVGPGFLASLRRHGLRLNLLAASVVLLGVATAVVVRFAAGVEPAAVVGLLSGATTNTPSLAGAQQALKQAVADPRRARAPWRSCPASATPSRTRSASSASSCVMLGVRAGFRVALRREIDEFDRSRADEAPPLARANLEVANPNLVGMRLDRVPVLAGSSIVVSRIWQDGRAAGAAARHDAAAPATCSSPSAGREDLDALRVVVGRESEMNLRSLPSAITTKRLIVTRAAATGRTIGELDFLGRFGVQITRVSRAEVEMSAVPGFELQYGDTVLAVGEPGDIQKVAAELGDSPKTLDYPHLVPMFLGIALGIVIGSRAVLAARRAGPGAPRARRRAAARGDRPRPRRQDRPARLVHADLGELRAARDRHRPLPRRRRPRRGRRVRRDDRPRPGPALDGRRRRDHRRADPGRSPRRAGRC